MDIKSFLNNVCKEIKYEPAQKAISEELELHMKEVKEVKSICFMAKTPAEKLQQRGYWL